jgi:hypothetical protein
LTIEEQDFIELRLADFPASEIIGRDVHMLRVAPSPRSRVGRAEDRDPPDVGLRAQRTRNGKEFG